MTDAGAKMRVLVVGNGMVGLRFLEVIAERAAGRFDITIVGEEPDAAYNRVLLSPLLAGDIATGDIVLKDRGWYRTHAMTLVTGDGVVALDTSCKIATLASGRTLAYDVCVLATGSMPIRLPVPGGALEGVEVFRTAADASALSAAGRNGSHAVVIGGGLLGIEAAYGLQRAGATVTLLHVMDRLMERQLDAYGADILRRALEDKGIRVLLNAQTAEIVGGAHVTGVRLVDGTVVPADRVVMAVGVKPRVDLAIASGIATKRGILVNDQLQTSVPGIYAIGECAEHNGAVYGLVEPGYEHARVAAEALCGGDAAYGGTVLATNLKVSGVPVFSAGDFDAQDAEAIVWRDRARQTYRKFSVRAGKLVGTVLVGDTSDALWYRDLIRDGTAISAFRSTLAFGRTHAEAA